jgi:hypothetical protein
VKYRELTQELGKAELDADGPVFEARPTTERQALRAAAKAAELRYFAEAPALLRKLVAEQPASPFGYEVALELIRLADHVQPTPRELDAWVGVARAFADGPQLEAATMGYAVRRLSHHAAYANATRRYAAEADQLARAADMPVKYRALVAEYDAERAAWAGQPNPPPEGTPWDVTVSGRVTDARGNAMAGAEVGVNNLQWVKVLRAPDELKARTGADGRYTITVRCQGSYRLHITQVCAEKRGFVRSVDTDLHRLLPGQTATINFTLRGGELFGGTLKVRPESWEHNLPPGQKFERVLVIHGPGVEETVLVANGQKFERSLPAGVYTVELADRGPSKARLKWTGLETGRTDHQLEEPPFQFTPKTVGAGFDALWSAMDRNYSYFVLKPKVSWAKLRDVYRPRAIQAKSAAELATVLTEMLGHLDDGHVWIEMPDGKQVAAPRKPWTYNGNRQVIRAQLTDVTECGAYAMVGKTRPDGFGYFLMTRQSAATPALVAQAVAAIERLRDVPGFVIDLRSANGGSEPLAQEVAQLFCGQRVVYARSRYRNGSRHDDLSTDQPRELPPARSGRPYLKPVVCLLGPGCVSSGEGFAQMLTALPHVTSVGLPTRGSSGNPGPVDVGDTGLTVYFSRWLDLMPDGTPIEGRGIPPTVRVDAAVDRYRDADPTLAKGLEVLRARVTGGR